jgi:hypothetical protein
MKYADFDLALEEANAEPMVIKLYGQEWPLPGVMPAAVPLRMARLLVDGKDQESLTMPELLTIAGDVFPTATLDAWLGKGLDIELLTAIVKWVFEQYMGVALDDGQPDLGEAQAPSSSSSGGGSSKPTSPASTASTSPVPSTA